MDTEHDPNIARAREITLARLEDQIDWYDRKSTSNRIWHMRFKIATLMSAAAIPFSAAIGAPAYVGGGLGALVVIIEGLQQLFQFHNNWVAYRAACESLKHEKFLFFADAGPYAGTANPQRLLAERIEGLVSTETGKWIADQSKSPGKEEGRS